MNEYKMNFHYFPREGGFTVSKSDPLPDEFEITEYKWKDVSLWFVDQDEFTGTERQQAYHGYKMYMSREK